MKGGSTCFTSKPEACNPNRDDIKNVNFVGVYYVMMWLQGRGECFSCFCDPPKLKKISMIFNDL